MIVLKWEPKDGSTQQNVSWVLRNFLSGICNGYRNGAPRREEAMTLCIDVTANLFETGQITEEEQTDMFDEFHEIHETIFPVTVKGDY